MRRLLAFLTVLVAVAAATVVLAAPVSAQGAPCIPSANGSGAATCTAHLTDFTPPSMSVTPMTCPNGTVIPGGVLTITIETAVFHITVNTAQDFWVTTTEQGNLTLAGDNGVSYTGHFEGWFGQSANRSNFVVHDIFNVVAHGSDGSTFGFHMVLHWSTNASGTMVMFANLTCT